MNGLRWTTGIGIALGGAGGAIAALMGAPNAPTPSAAPAAASASARETETETETQSETESETQSAPAPAPAPASASASASAPAPAPAPASAAPPIPLPERAPTDVPTTREALLKAQLYCDQRKDFDECTRAAHAFEVGSAGPADPEQAKRFRKIALTHLVLQCENGGSPHACFVLAAKYRAGTEVALSPTGAMALEKRALELCRHRAAPECPSP